MSHSPFEQQSPQYYVQQNNSVDHFQGSKYKEKATIFGIVGFFILGIVFGPLAIINANKAEKLHHSATLGKVLGWVDTICGAIGIIIVFVFIIAAASAHQ